MDLGGLFKEAEELARNIFGKKKDGFFIEVGAFDGEIHTNSLYFEAIQVMLNLQQVESKILMSPASPVFRTVEPESLPFNSKR